MEPLDDAVGPSLGELPPLEPRENPTRRVRPHPVTLIASFQFFRAGFLLLVAALVWEYPDVRSWSSLTLWELFYIASSVGGPPGILTPILAVYFAAVGLGLWNLQRWARTTVLVTCGIQAAMWLRYLLMAPALDWALDHKSHMPKPGFEQSSIYGLIFLDMVFFCYLAAYPGVAHAFGEVTQQE